LENVMSEPLRCSLCNKMWDTLPPDAVRIGQRRGAFQMYRFASDGSVHNLGLARLGFLKGVKHAPKAVKEIQK
jgi:hypothetical protein